MDTWSWDSGPFPGLDPGNVPSAPGERKPPPLTESGIEVVAETHNSGQHKDREAAAAEVRRMWQPTPSWSQPDADSGTAPESETESPAEEVQPAALSQEFPGDSWSQPAPRDSWT